MTEARDVAIEIEGAFFEETRRVVSTEEPSIEIAVTAVEAIDSFPSTIDAFVSATEATAAIEEAFTS